MATLRKRSLANGKGEPPRGGVGAVEDFGALLLAVIAYVDACCRPGQDVTDSLPTWSSESGRRYAS